MYSIIENNVLIKFDERDMDSNGRYVVPDGVSVIGEGAFYDVAGLKLKEVILPDSVESIERDAFYGLEDLENIRLSNNLVYLGDYAFFGCKNIKNIELPESLKILKNGCFYMCEKLTHVNMPTKLDEIGELVFCCSGVEELTVLGKPIKDRYHIENIEKSYHFLQYAIKNKKFIPNNNTAMMLTAKKDIEGFFKYSKSWQDILDCYTKKWATFLQEEYGQAENIGFVRDDLYRICLALGVFEEGKQQKEVVKFIKDNILEYDPNQLHKSFSGMHTREFGYNKEFAEFYMANFREAIEQHGVKLNFLEYLKSAVIKTNITSEVYNQWFIRVKDAYPNRATLRHREHASENNSFTEDIIMDLFKGHIHYHDIQEGNEKLADMAGVYGYSQHDFMELQEAFNIGKSINPENMILSIKPDTETSGVSFEYLSKNDETAAFLGEYTNCCQTANGLGRNCLFYGLSKANSGFVKFKQGNYIIGQSWVWYNEETGHVCLDNIEIPERRKKDVEANKNLGESFVRCIKRLSDAIVLGMNEKGYVVNMVSVGAGCNDLKEIRLFEKQELSESILPFDYFGYSDATEVIYIVDKNIKNNIESSQSVVGHDESLEVV